MNHKEIENKINAKKNTFLNEPIKDEIYPEWFYKKFSDAFMSMNQAQVPYRAQTIDSIWKKIEREDPNTFTLFEAEFMAMVWMSVSPIILDKDIPKFIRKRVYLEGLVGKAYKLKTDKDLALQKEAKVMNELAGNGPRRDSVISMS